MGRAPKTRLSRGDDYESVAALWIARALVVGKGERAFVSHRGWRDDDVAGALGLDGLDEGEFSRDDLLRVLRQRHAELERKRPQIRGPLSDNAARLAEALGLNATERQVLEASVLAVAIPELRDAVALMLRARKTTPAVAFATMLDQPVHAIEQALRPDAALVQAGLIRIDACPRLHAMDFDVDLLTGLGAAMLHGQADLDTLLQRFFRQSPPAELAEEDYPHLTKDRRALEAVLRAARQDRLAGLNILIYGPPGVGKTQFARLLAARVGCSLYEISSQDEDGDPLRGMQRFRIYQLCQSLLARRADALVLFDEVEDVLTDDVWPFFGTRRHDTPSKAWVNRLLEQNIVPSFWLANGIGAVDPAFLRRFDLVLEIKTPPRRVRARMLAETVADLGVRPEWIEQIADYDGLTPAQVTQAARVARLISRSGPASPEELERVMHVLITHHLRLQGHSVHLPSTRRAPGLRYALEHVRADADLEQLVSGLAASGTGRVFLYGPPGTGKTAFARHVARALGRRLLTRRASDLLSMWVGGTERQIARMFEEAREEDAVLLLDEADSFLRGRALAGHSWEVTQVNELLVQMEAFDGIFLCATNFREVTDQAALRRFDVKLRFNYLDGARALGLLQAALEALGMPVLEGNRLQEARRRLNALPNLAPGDFATVLRQAHVLGRTPSPDALLEALEAECRLKPDAPRAAIGFVH